MADDAMMFARMNTLEAEPARVDAYSSGDLKSSNNRTWNAATGVAPFWTATHPAGIRAMRDDYRAGTITAVIVTCCMFAAFALILFVLVRDCSRVFAVRIALLVFVVIVVAHGFTAWSYLGFCISMGEDLKLAEELQLPSACLTQYSDVDFLWLFVSLEFLNFFLFLGVTLFGANCGYDDFEQWERTRVDEVCDCVV